MTGSIQKRGSVWVVRYRHCGIHYSESSRSADRSVAESLLKRRLNDLVSGGRVQRLGNRTVADPGLYFLIAQATGLIKIGCSDDVVSRMRHLGTTNADCVELLVKIPALNHRRLERYLHSAFAVHRVHGEWFNLTQKSLAEAVKMASELATTRTRNRQHRHTIRPTEITLTADMSVGRFADGEWFKCPGCADTSVHKDFKFCPSCGAKVRKG